MIHTLNMKVFKVGILAIEFRQENPARGFFVPIFSLFEVAATTTTPEVLRQQK